MKTKEQIVAEAVAYISANGRSINGDVCVYLSPDGNMCAVGMFFTTEALASYGAKIMSITEISGRDDVDTLLKEEYRGHDLDFWQRLQYLHDNVTYWIQPKELPSSNLLELDEYGLWLASRLPN